MNAPTALSGFLPRLSGNVATARTLVARHGADIPVRLSSDMADGSTPDWRVTLTPGIPDAVRQSATLATEIEWAGARLRLGLPSDAPAVWLAARMPELDLATLPQPLLDTALEAMLGEILAAVDRASSAGPARVVPRDSAMSTPLPHAWTLALQAAHHGPLRYATLQADDLGLMLLAALISKAEPAGNTLALDSLPVQVRAVIGHTDLSATALQSLAPRDVVLLDEYLVDRDGELWLAVENGQGVRVRHEHSSYVVTQGWTTLASLASSMTHFPTPSPHSPDQPDTSGASDTPGTETTTQARTAADETSEPRSHHGDPLDMAGIPVRLSFDLGERQLTLADLRKLQPGETFDLQRPLTDGPVMIRANGALIGTGDLVEVDGRVGVVIHQLGHGAA